jgi:3-phenylpropionate/cinnamic acid dioxygenase small subunit
MTLDELLARESIRQTMANYTTAGDRLRVDDFAAVFTEDAILESDGVPAADAFRYEGRTAVANWLSRWNKSADNAAERQQASFVRHHLSTSQIEMTANNKARARTYWVAYTDIGPDHAGYYLDKFRKTGDQWLISHRKVRLDWRSPKSLFSTAVARTQ